MTNALYYGDNLDVLRDHIPDQSVDLVYLDPPFNSDATYNLLFRAPAGQRSEAQIEAFADTWHWGEGAARAFDEVLHSRHTGAATMLRAMRSFLGENDMMAYLAMMAVRLIELHRVLKPTGSLYLHCDPKASHYLKILLDAVFGKSNYKNEIIWCYRKWSVSASQFVRNHDVIHFISKNEDNKFNVLSTEPSKGTMKRWKGKKQQAVFEEGVRKATSIADEVARTAMPDWWEISIINPNAAERLGYPTQKPLALLERIIKASSNEGDVVLDPFCGCGTTVHAAQKLERRWIGIDITHLAISLIERRLIDAFPGIAFEVHGTPKDLEGARDLARRDKYQFQWWAVSLVDAVPQGGKKKGADRGIDGIRWVRTGPRGGDVEKVLVSVKGGEHVTSAMVRDLKGTVEREGAAAGLFITLAAPTREMRREAAASGFFDTSFGRHPRLQIFTIEELLAGMRPELPSHGSGEGFRKAARERGAAAQGDFGL